MCNASIIVVGEKQCTGTTIAPPMTKQMISLHVRCDHVVDRRTRNISNTSVRVTSVMSQVDPSITPHYR